MPADPAHLWPADAGRVLVLAGGVLWLVGPGVDPVRVTSVPDGALSVAAVWTLSDPVVAALSACPVARTPGKALVYPAVRLRAVLWRYVESTGWRQLAEVAAGNGLSLSADGHRLAWVEPLSAGPEEAGQGEVRGFDIDRGSLLSLTQGAGRLVDLKVAPDGSGVVYLANHQASRPITTHTDLWSVPWEGGPPRRLTGGNRYVDHWGWSATPGQLWVTCLRGMAPVSELVGLDGGYRPWPYPVPATSSVAWLDQGRAAFGVESREEYPGLWLAGVRIAVPQAEPYDDLRVTATGWRAPDGLEIEGLVYDTPRTSPDAPLLVQVHAGSVQVLAGLG